MSRPSIYARLKSGKFFALALALLLAASALVVTAYGKRSRFAPAPPPAEAGPAQQEAEAPADARVALFTLTPTGFEPRAVTLAAGEYLLVFNNRTGLDDFALRFGRGVGAEARGPRRGRVLRQMHRLTPGTYLVTEAGHPDWTLRLSVTAR